jgi:hypothetical protein
MMALPTGKCIHNPQPEELKNAEGSNLRGGVKPGIEN